MYKVDQLDKVIEVEGIPQSDIGSPRPGIISDEGRVILGYYVQEMPIAYGEQMNESVDNNPFETIAIIEFSECSSFTFGQPNDEVMNSHPLYTRGLQSYGAYEVCNSSWLRQLERANSVHPHHNPDRFWEKHHYVFTFHDSTFECIARGFDIEVRTSMMKIEMMRLAEKIWQF